MHILQLCTNFRPGGIQRHVLDLGAELARRGHSVTYIGGRGAWAAAIPPESYVEIDLTAVSDSGGALPARLAALARASRKLRGVIRARGADLLHAHETAPALAARLATLGRDIPRVMTFHGSEPHRFAEVARISRLSADWVLSPSHTSVDDLVRHGLPRARARVMGLGIAHRPAPDPAAVAALRKRLLGREEGILCLSLSRLAPQKGLDHMVEVARRAISAVPGLVFAVGGQGPLDGQVQDWARAAGLGDRFRVLGQVEAVPEHLAAADLFLLTSRWESLPISIVEAFRAGLPVIATDCGGVAELVDDSVGRLCPVGDIDGLTAAVAGLAGDDALRRSLGAAARARSTGPRFEPDAVHAAFDAFYREIARR